MKIAIIGPIHEDGYNILKNERYDFFEINNFKADFLKSKLHDVDGIILRTAKLSKNILSKCKKLKINFRITLMLSIAFHVLQVQMLY